MSSQKSFIDNAKVFGKGKIQVPKEVRKKLDVKDGDKIVFFQNEQGEVFLEKAPKLKSKGFGRYT